MQFYVALQTVPGIRWYNLMEFLYEGNCKLRKKCTLTSFVVLGMGSVENAPKIVSPSRKWSSTPVGLVKDFLANNNVTTMENTLYFPGLPSADFYLFPRLKSALKGRRFCDCTDIIQNAKKELKSLSQNCFQEGFQRLYSHRQKCKVAQGDYRKEMLLKWVHWFVFIRNSYSGNILKLISKTLLLPIIKPTMYKICGS